MDGLNGQLTILRRQDGQPNQGVLLNGCFNYPKQHTTNGELIWGTASLPFALYHLKTR